MASSNKTQPRDAEIMTAILKDMGVTDYEPRVINQMLEFAYRKEMLVPLTSSLYVPGKLQDVNNVLIDIGTGYYVEKSLEEAKKYFKRKVDFVTKQMEKVQPVLIEKSKMRQVVTEVMNMKIQAQMAQMQSQQAKS
nr:prefoldin subunit 5-like [Lytechinus pictus]